MGMTGRERFLTAIANKTKLLRVFVETARECVYS